MPLRMLLLKVYLKKQATGNTQEQKGQIRYARKHLKTLPSPDAGFFGQIKPITCTLVMRRQGDGKEGLMIQNILH